MQTSCYLAEVQEVPAYRDVTIFSQNLHVHHVIIKSTPSEEDTMIWESSTAPMSSWSYSITMHAYALKKQACFGQVIVYSEYRVFRTQLLVKSPPPPKPLTCRPYDNSYPATCAKDFLAHKKQIRHCCRHEAVIASSSCGGSERMLVQVFVGG